MKWITYRKAALKVLNRMPKNQRALIQSKIEIYARDPASLANNVIKLAGRQGCRLRIGDWRVIFDDTETDMDVLAIGPRGSVYD